MSNDVAVARRPRRCNPGRREIRARDDRRPDTTSGRTDCIGLPQDSFRDKHSTSCRSLSSPQWILSYWPFSRLFSALLLFVIFLAGAQPLLASAQAGWWTVHLRPSVR